MCDLVVALWTAGSPPPAAGPERPERTVDSDLQWVGEAATVAARGVRRDIRRVVEKLRQQPCQGHDRCPGSTKHASCQAWRQLGRPAHLHRRAGVRCAADSVGRGEVSLLATSRWGGGCRRAIQTALLAGRQLLSWRPCRRAANRWPRQPMRQLGRGARRLVRCLGKG
jgi:hypothetical protein